MPDSALAKIAAAFMEITSVIDTAPYEFSEEISSKENPYHWQQPCCTELEALKLHQNLSFEESVDVERKVLNTYLGIPWASFIDKKWYLGELVNALKPRIAEYKTLVRKYGYTLRVHSVCQSIHWRRYLDHMGNIGITDLHASHYSEVIPRNENAWNIKMHSWHLYAVNVEDEKRNENISFKEPDSPLLASFRGASMPHYLSDVRLLLVNAVKKDKFRDDVVVELNDEWHFNNDVFGRQVGALKDTAHRHKPSNNDIHIYNDLLCRSVFSLCPEGAGINTIRLWESLAVGAIPVLILGKPHVPMLFKLHPELYKCCVVFFRDDVVDIFRHLRNISKDTITRKKKLCRKVYLEIKKQTTFENQYNNILETL